ncbi:DUF294 nucleotidyltransferase-like domain-containing protein [Neptunicella sp. SCSIO 80796]|uniref:DUF294 nucleotidyltransferase-like domain-containing protein n=1 Tax=Neptunicella plasticusilytica TaxID=3117012 RepID=UPI003A4E0037
MTAVPQQVIGFLQASAPFDSIDETGLQDIAADIRVIYLTNENKQALLAQQGNALFLIHTGQFLVKDSDSPLRYVSEGDYFGYGNLLDETNIPIELEVDSPGLVYCLNEQRFVQCLQQYPEFERFFNNSKAQSLQNQAADDSNSMWLYKSLTELLNAAPVTADVELSIHHSAKLMSDTGVSSLLITDNEKLVGIVTDRDIRNRVVAQQRDINQPIKDIMTTEPVLISHQRTLFDAMSYMTEHNVHHLPVIDSDSRKPLGIITVTDVIRYQRGNILFLIGELSKAKNLYELTRLSWQMPHYFSRHARRPGDFDIAGKVLSQATDIMTRKLLQFFVQQHGEAPFDYCWLVYGSQAREDQFMGSDQDNGLLLAQTPDEQQAAYFEAMAKYVCDGLAKCGIKLCKGNVMATNPDLRKSVDDAIEEAKQWVKTPTAQAILNFNIYLDVRAVAGNKTLLNRLQKARVPLFKQSFFLSALARHAIQGVVPLTMFQKFSYESDHKVKDAINLKRKAVGIINDIVRLYALANGLSMPSTLERLKHLPTDSGLTKKDADNLRDIWLFLNRLRWRHQLQNHVTDNLVSVSDLSAIEKHQLKASLQGIRVAQQGVQMKFTAGLG